MLSTLFRYQAWAHDGFLRAIEALDAGRHPEQRHLALRVLNHVYVVNQIFTGHLTGQPHGYEANNTVDTPTPEALRAAHAASDRWFLEYLASITPEQLAERVAFRFSCTLQPAHWPVLEPVLVVDFTGFSPGTCDIVFVRESTLSPSRTFVLVCDFEKVPPSCAIAFDWPFSPLPVSLT